MKAHVLLASFVVLAMTAAAQQPAPTQQVQQPAASFGVAGMEGMQAPNSNSPVMDPLTLSILQSAACPVSLKAGFNSDGQMVKVRKPGEPDPGPARGPAQHIRIVLGSQGKSAIASVRVTAYGLTARRRMDRTSDPMVKGPSDIRRTLEIAQFILQKDGSVAADVVLPGFTAVKTVRLESIRYADGTAKDFAGKPVCSVPVNPMMLVADR